MTSFTNSAIKSLHTTGKALHLIFWVAFISTSVVYHAGISALALIWKACMMVYAAGQTAYALGQAARKLARSEAAAEWAREELAPTMAAAQAAQSWWVEHNATAVVQSCVAVAGLVAGALKDGVVELFAEDWFVTEVAIAL